KDVILRLYGSDTIGEELAPRLAKRFLEEKNAHDIIEDKDKFEQTPEGKAPVIRVSGVIDGNRKAIEIKPRKSSFGFSSLADGTCDIAMSSDAISPTYKLLLEREGISGMEGPHAQYAIAYDAIAVIVHHTNPLRSLSLSQVRSLFTGQTANWSEI